MLEQSASFLNLDNGNKIAYRLLDGKGPWVVFLHGYQSDIWGNKVEFLHNYCQQYNRGFLAMEYFHHGASSGSKADLTVGSCLESVLICLDKFITQPCTLIGSSMGGWLMLLAALKRSALINNLIGIAAAPDWTENLLWQQMSTEQQQEISAKGYIDDPDAGRFYYKLISEARNHLLLQDKIAIDKPIHLLHGMQDNIVPWSISRKILNQVTSNNVKLTLIKDAEHRFNREQDLEVLKQLIF